MPGAHWLNKERLRVYPRIFLAMFVLVGMGYAFTFRNRVDYRGTAVGADFITFWAASDLVLAARGADVYIPATLVAAEQAVWPGSMSAYLWFYPATMLLAVAPLALLPYVPSLLVFLSVSLTAFLAALRGLVFDRRGWWLVAGFPGVWMALAHGQNSLLTAALAGRALILLPRRPVAAGVLVGLLVVKPQLAILFPLVLIATREWRAVAAAAATASGVAAVSLAAFGPQTVPAWLESMRIATMLQEIHWLKLEKMPSLFAWLLGFGVPASIAMVPQIILGMVVAGVVLIVWLRTTVPELRGVVLMTGTFLALPYSFDYDLVWLAFPIAWLASIGVRAGWRSGERPALVALWVLPIVIGAAGLGHLPLGPVVLGATLVLVLRRIREADTVGGAV